MTDNESLRRWLDAVVEGAYRAGAEQERAAVVAYLRYEAERLTGTNTTDAFRASEYLGASADEIERGEHRREEGA
jgi:hypothetical protein